VFAKVSVLALKRFVAKVIDTVPVTSAVHQVEGDAPLPGTRLSGGQLVEVKPWRGGEETHPYVPPYGA
jgi:hypothetical protein